MSVATALSTLTTTLGRMIAVSETLQIGQEILSDRTNQLQKSMSDMLRIQESAAISNRRAIEVNTLEMANMRGGLRGVVQSQTELNRLGFSRNVGEMARLGAAMKISNQDMKAYIELNKNLFGAGGVNETALNSLALTIEDTAIRTGMSNQLLIQGINQLREDLIGLSFLGGDMGAGPAAEFMLAIQSSVPPALNEAAVNFGKQLMSGQVDVNQLARLGIEDLVNQVVKGQGDASLLASQIIQTASQNYSDVVGTGANQSIRTMQAMDGVLGTLGKQATILRDAAVEANGTFDGIRTLINNTKEIFGQFVDAIGSAAVASLKSAITGLSSLLASLSVALSPVFLALAGLGNVIGAIVTALSPIISIVGAIGALYGAIQLLLVVFNPVTAAIVGLVGVVGGILSFFGVDLAEGVVDVLGSFFDSKESEDRQEDLRRAESRAIGIEDTILNDLRALFGVQFSTSEEIARRMLAQLQAGLVITDMPTERQEPAPFTGL